MNEKLVCINCGIETNLLLCGLVCSKCWDNPGGIV